MIGKYRLYPETVMYYNLYGEKKQGDAGNRIFGTK